MSWGFISFLLVQSMMKTEKRPRYFEFIIGICSIFVYCDGIFIPVHNADNIVIVWIYFIWVSVYELFLFVYTAIVHLLLIANIIYIVEWGKNTQKITRGLLELFRNFVAFFLAGHSACWLVGFIKLYYKRYLHQLFWLYYELLCSIRTS